MSESEYIDSSNIDNPELKVSSIRRELVIALSVGTASSLFVGSLDSAGIISPNEYAVSNPNDFRDGAATPPEAIDDAEGMFVERAQRLFINVENEIAVIRRGFKLAGIHMRDSELISHVFQGCQSASGSISEEFRELYVDTLPTPKLHRRDILSGEFNSSKAIISQSGNLSVTDLGLTRYLLYELTKHRFLNKLGPNRVAIMFERDDDILSSMREVAVTYNQLNQVLGLDVSEELPDSDTLLDSWLINDFTYPENIEPIMRQKYDDLLMTNLFPRAVEYSLEHKTDLTQHAKAIAAILADRELISQYETSPV